MRPHSKRDRSKAQISDGRIGKAGAAGAQDNGRARVSTTTSVDSNRCAECGTEILEAASTPIEARAPCHKCGSTHRSISLSAHATMQLTASADARVIRYESDLIDEARRLFSEGRHGLAIIISHTRVK
jgi:hypothetical protein